MQYSSNKSRLYAALFQFQGKVKSIPKTVDNSYFSSTYADLAGIMDTIRQPLQECGLLVVQNATVGTELKTVKFWDKDGQYEENVPVVTITTTIVKVGDPAIASGEDQTIAIEDEWMEETVSVTPKENTPQAIGSCITYMRRYSLMPMLGITCEAEDDDGEGAMARGKRELPSKLTPAMRGEDQRQPADRRPYQAPVGGQARQQTQTPPAGKPATDGQFLPPPPKTPPLPPAPENGAQEQSAAPSFPPAAATGATGFPAGTGIVAPSKDPKAQFYRQGKIGRILNSDFQAEHRLINKAQLVNIRTLQKAKCPNEEEFRVFLAYTYFEISQVSPDYQHVQVENIKEDWYDGIVVTLDKNHDIIKTVGSKQQ